MGHRCNYVLRERGQATIHYSQWGAMSLPMDLLAGPEAFIAGVRDSRVEGRLLDSVFAEGVALVDLDRRQLLVFGGTIVRYLLPARSAWLELVRASWPGWRVEWSLRGVVGVAAALGWDTLPLDNTRPAVPDAAALSAAAGNPFAWITIADDGTVLDYGHPLEVGELLLAGPVLLDHVRRRVESPLPREDGGLGGVLARVAERELHWWSTGRLWPSERQLADLWPGWRLHYLEEGHLALARLSGRDPEKYRLPEDEVGRYVLMELYPRETAADVASLGDVVARLRAEGKPV